MLAGITNTLYTRLGYEHFKDLAIFLSLLEKQMFSLLAIREIVSHDEDGIILTADIVD